MLNIIFIRHLKTKGNKEKRYIGTTDESLLKEEIEKVEVTYIKGKYAYNTQYNVISGKKHEILYAGPVNALQPALENILMLVRNPTRRICTDSRKTLRKLEEKATNLNNFKDQGITHIIIYICSRI